MKPEHSSISVSEKNQLVNHCGNEKGILTKSIFAAFDVEHLTKVIDNSLMQWLTIIDHFLQPEVDFPRKLEEIQKLKRV